MPVTQTRPAGTRRVALTHQARWLQAQLERYQAQLLSPTVVEPLLTLAHRMQQTAARGRKVIFAGNGGSAAIASHCAIDFAKNAGIRSVCFNDPSLITCLANDYGYEQWLAKAMAFYADDGDLIVLISSSGRSPNMLNAARYATAQGWCVMTFTGFDAANPLRSLGQLNFWVESTSYNIIEMTHHIWLLAVCDLLVDAPAKRRAAEEAPHGAAR